MKKNVPFFYHQVAALLSSGLTLTRSLSVLERQGSNQQKKMFRRIREQVKQGATFSQSIRGFPVFFTNLDVSLIQIGELNGQLIEMLNYMAERKSAWIDLKRQIVSRSLYPVILLHVGILVKFIVLYFSGHTKLGTEMFYTVLLFYGPLILFFILKKVAFYSPSLKWLVDAFLFYIPFTRGLIKGLAHMWFASTLSMLLKSGISTVQGLKLAVTSTGNLIIVQKLKCIPDDVSNDIPLDCAMERTGIFPSSMVALVRTGEESGKIIDMLDRISHLAQHEIRQAFIQLGKIIPGLFYLVIILWITSLII